MPDFSRPAGLPQIAILGTGLIGGSLGLALKANFAAESVIGWDPDARACDSAVARGAVDSCAESASQAAGDADVVFLAPPTESVIPLLESVASSLKREAVVTDVGSAKARIVEEGERILAGRFVGGHPMAGSEDSGIRAADGSIYNGAVWILTPTDRTDSSALNLVRELVAKTGAIPRECDAEEHDRMVAFVSHLPHILAYGLAESAGNEISNEWVDMAAGSFRDVTRVAFSNPARWAEILLQNRAAAADSLESFIAWAARAHNALSKSDRAALTALLTKGHAARKRFPK